MGNLKLGVIFGGMSTENEVSITSAKYVLDNLDADKYDIFPIYIDKTGDWYEYIRESIDCNSEQILDCCKKIENVIEYLKSLNVVFPVLHGLYGEDGTVQGLLELLKIPYVGCGVLASSVGMDKVYSKIVFERAKIKQAKYVYIQKYKDYYIYMDENFNSKNYEIDEVCKFIDNEIKYPMFVKPSNSGSSVGINKVKNMQELKEAIEYAAQFDKKIIIEEGIVGREIECAVLGNEEAVASCVGEIKPAEEFYSYDAKYNNKESVVEIPANIDREKEKEIQNLALKAFRAIDGKGLSRVDFFLEEGTQEIYINEINTLPGFTSISMYPKLFNEVGISYSSLIDKLIELAM